MPVQLHPVDRQTIMPKLWNIVDRGPRLLLLLAVPLSLAHQPLLIPLIGHENQRRRRLLSTNTSTASLFQGYGTHYVDLWCGTPPQRQTVIVDTGSDVTAFPCSGCDDCGQDWYHTDGVFRPEDSSTFSKLSCADCLRGSCAGNECELHASYREGSGWQAYEAEDYCYLGGWHADAVDLKRQPKEDGLDPASAARWRFPLKFGCQRKVSGAFRTQLADGIMGMEHAKAALWRQVSQRDPNVTNMLKPTFALCFSSAPSTHRNGSRAGILTFGGVDERVHDQGAKLVYSRGTGRKTSYHGMTVRKMYLQAQSAEPIRLNITEEALNREEISIDSGSTDTYFTKELVAPFQDVWRQLVGTDFDRNRRMKRINHLPDIILQLRGANGINRLVLASNNGEPLPNLAGDLDPDYPLDVIVRITPRNMFEYYGGSFHARLHFDPNYDSAIGASGMMGYNIVFDTAHDRIGWAPSSCDYEQVLQRHSLSAERSQVKDLVANDTSLNDTEVKETDGLSNEPVTADQPDLLSADKVVIDDNVEFEDAESTGSQTDDGADDDGSESRASNDGDAEPSGEVEVDGFSHDEMPDLSADDDGSGPQEPPASSAGKVAAKEANDADYGYEDDHFEIEPINIYHSRQKSEGNDEDGLCKTLWCRASSFCSMILLLSYLIANQVRRRRQRRRDSTYQVLVKHSRSKDDSGSFRPASTTSISSRAEELHDDEEEALPPRQSGHRATDVFRRLTRNY